MDNENPKESLNFNIEGLSSLQGLSLITDSTEMQLSLRNLKSLRILDVIIIRTIDDNFITRVLDQVQHLEELDLHANYSYFNLGSFVNLKLLSLVGSINEDFNYDLFKNICYQLEEVNIYLTADFDEKKLFDGCTFSNLKTLAIRKSNIKRLNKEFFYRFPFLTQLFILECNVEEIEPDSFVNLKELTCLDFTLNRLKYIEKDTFF